MDKQKGQILLLHDCAPHLKNLNMSLIFVPVTFYLICFNLPFQTNETS